MANFDMRIITNDSDNSQHRIIIECNGVELDILSDAQGISCTLQKDLTILNELNHDWE